MRMVIFGAQGYFGKHMLRIYPEAIGSGADIADAADVARILDREHPAIVVNCAGKTGRPNVDWCEDHKMETLRSNVTGPLMLLEACLRRSMRLVHFSTGCIYDGDTERAFTEDDAPNFTGSFYSRSKGWTDQILRDFSTFPDHHGGVLTLRLRMPFDGVPHERNLITKLVKYSRVLDAPNSLTYLPDFLSVTKTLIERDACGTYNIVNPGWISPYRIMELYREIVDPAHTFSRLTLAELPGEVRAGRSNCILSGAKLEREGIALQPVEGALRQALAAYRKFHERIETHSSA